MKFRIKSYMYLLAFCLLPALSGCSKDRSPAPVEGTPVTVQLDLGVAPVRRATTRAAEMTTNMGTNEGFRIEFADTPSILVTRAEADEKKIDHLWLLQYAASGPLTGMLLAKDEILSPVLVDGEGQIEATLTYGDDCDLFVVANAPTLGNNPLIESRSDFRSMLYDFTAQDEFPMVGHYRGKVPATMGIAVELERMTSKIELNVYDGTGSLTFTSAILKSVPTKSYFYNRQTLDQQENWLTPAVSTDPFENSTAFTQLLPFDSSTEYSPYYLWYMLENRRGTTGSTITEQKDKWMGNSPTYNIDGSGTSYATHIELQMDYDNGSEVTPIIVTFFPGETSEYDEMVLYNSFNIPRNCYYNIYVSFSNLDEEDPRIEKYSPLPTIQGHTGDDSTGGEAASIVWGSGVTGAQITVYFPVGDEYVAAAPITVANSSSTGWEILKASVPVGYNTNVNGQIIKVAQTIDGMLPSKKALYKLPESSGRPMPEVGVTFLGTED